MVLYILAGGGTLCGVAALVLLIISTATDFWLHYRYSGSLANQGLWRFCINHKCHAHTIAVGECFGYMLYIETCFGMKLLLSDILKIFSTFEFDHILHTKYSAFRRRLHLQLRNAFRYAFRHEKSSDDTSNMAYMN